MSTHIPDQIEHIATGTLIPYARNSRTHSPGQVEAVAASIREFGFTNPVLIDGNNTIIAGHGRVMAAQSLGLPAVPCIRLGHLTGAQRRAYVIADNKLAELSGWDMATLAREVEDLAGESFDTQLLGFTDADLSELLGTGDAPAGGDGDQPAPDKPFNYQEKYAVLVDCASESDQAKVYDRLVGLGYACKVLVN